MSELLDFLQKREIKKFIQEHLQSNIQKLLLNPPAEFGSNAKEIVSQIQARQKAKGKLDSWVTNPDLIFPQPLSVEQSSSEKTAAYKKTIIRGGFLIDLTGGMGIDCLALSENFNQTTYIEVQHKVAEVFNYNCKQLNKSIEVINQDSENYLLDLTEDSSNDIVFFIDPARRNEEQSKVFKLEDCSPNILEILPSLRKRANRVLVKLSPLLDIKSILVKIPNIKELHIVSLKNNCKELLVLIDFSYDGDSLIKAVNLDKDDQEFVFTMQEEQSAEAVISSVDQFLFEPNASILKAGAFKKVGVDFGLKKVQPNTHFYTAGQIVSKWPGRTFEILDDKVDKKQIKKYAPSGHINVLTRNHPLNATQLKKKFKLKDGGEFFLIGFKDKDEKARLVVGRKC